MNAEKNFLLENLDEFHLEIVRRPIEEICKFYREDDENVSWADVASEKNSAETADAEGAERVQVNVDASPEGVKSVQLSVEGTPEKDVVEVFLKALLGTLEKMGAINREDDDKGVSCVELPPEALAEAFEELYPADPGQKTPPIRYGFTPVSAPDVSVFFEPRFSELALRAGGSRTGKTSVFSLRYAKSDGYICELREEEKSWRDSKLLRLVRVMYDGRNVFWQEGEPYPFERVEQYSNRKVKQRFALNDALDYLTQLGFPVRDANFLKPAGRLYRWQDDRAIALQKRYEASLAAKEAERRRFAASPEGKLKSALTSRVEKLFAQTLEPLGFKQDKDDAQTWTRRAEILRHTCWFSDVDGELSVYCECGPVSSFACWANAPRDAATQRKLKRFWKGLRDEEEEGWAERVERKSWNGLPKSEAEVEAILTDVAKFLRDTASPFFRRFATVADFLREYDAGRIDKNFFDVDEEFWQDFYLALIRFHVGAYEEAASAFEAAVERVERGPKGVKKGMKLAVEAAQIAADCIRRRVESS